MALKCEEMAALMDDFESTSIKSFSSKISSTVGQTSSNFSHILCLAESRGAASEIGAASFDSSNFQTTLMQFSDTAGYSRTLQLLSIYPPAVVLISNSSLCESSPSKLCLALSDILNNVEIVFLSRLKLLSVLCDLL